MDGSLSGLGDISAPGRVAGPDEGITTQELALAARNHGLPLEALRYDVTPPGLHYVLVHYDIPATDAAVWRITVGRPDPWTQHLQIFFDPGLKSRLHGWTLPGRIGTQRDDRTTIHLLGAVAHAEIEIDNCRQRMIRPGPGRIRPTFRGALQRAPGRLRCQIILGFELLVEGALRQTGAGHQILQPDAVEPVLPEQAAGHVDDRLPVFLGLLPRHTHGDLQN